MIGYWKGKKRKPFSEIWKKNIGDSIKGKRHSKETIKKLKDFWTIEKREKISKRMKGDNNPMKNETFKNKLKKPKSEKAKKNMKNSWTEERRESISEKLKGKSKPIGFGEKISKASKENAKINPNYGMRRKHLTSEQIKKLRISIINYIKEVCGNIHPNVGYNEKQILDKVENELGYKIIRNYHIKELGYFTDGYIPELNLVIEVDERHHYIDETLKIKDLERQKEIEEYLKCKFMRIKDFS